jgi:isocitrate dehydrogenase
MELLKEEFGWEIRADSGIGIKPISKTGLAAPPARRPPVRVDRGRKNVHFVHKGNIMKYTEGAFNKWGYELVKEEFSDVAVSWEDSGGKAGDKILVQDAIADIALQQVLTRPAEFDVIATMNLNGDYLSTRWRPRSAASASPPAATPTTSPATASSRRPTARPRSTPARTRSTPARCCSPAC